MAMTAPPSGKTATDMASATPEGDLPWRRTDRGDQKIADTDAETNPQDQLDRSTQPLTARHAEAHDGSDRHEERSMVPTLCTPTSQEPRRQGCLDDSHGTASQTLQSTCELLA
jgi:hypothetical protein